MVNYWGANFFGHDASLCVVRNNKVLWHKKSGLDFLTEELINEAREFGEPLIVCYYEKPLFKRLRQFYSGEYYKALNLYNVRLHLWELGVFKPIKYFYHHQSHAAAGYYTSPFTESLILVADAIGEWETLSIWHGQDNKIKKLHSRCYPYSLGLFYSALTKAIGFKPNKEEWQLMMLSKIGTPTIYEERIKNLLKINLHKGAPNIQGDRSNIAASTQKIFEEEIFNHLKPYSTLSKNLVFMGGCAYNSLLVEKLKYKFDAVYTMNDPGDYNSSLGAVACLIQEKIKVKDN